MADTTLATGNVGSKGNGHADTASRLTAAQKKALAKAAKQEATKAAAKPATKMPAGLSVCERIQWKLDQLESTTTVTAVPALAADDKGIGMSHKLPFHPQGWTADEMADALEAYKGGDTGSTSTKLLGVKGSATKTTAKIPASHHAAALRECGEAGMTYNG